jgi:hypothetical protein
MLWAPAEALVVNAGQVAMLQRRVRAPSTPRKVLRRAKVVLAAAGSPNNATAVKHRPLLGLASPATAP